VALVVLEFEVWNTFPNYKRFSKVSAVVSFNFECYSSVTMHIVVVTVGIVLAVTYDLILKENLIQLGYFEFCHHILVGKT
jgi:hypothetical protein